MFPIESIPRPILQQVSNDVFDVDAKESHSNINQFSGQYKLIHMKATIVNFFLRYAYDYVWPLIPANVVWQNPVFVSATGSAYKYTNLTA